MQSPNIKMEALWKLKTSEISTISKRRIKYHSKFYIKKVTISFELQKSFMSWVMRQSSINSMSVQFLLNLIATFLSCCQSLKSMASFLQNYLKNLKIGLHKSLRLELSIWEEKEFYGWIKRYLISLITISSVILVLFSSYLRYRFQTVRTVYEIVLSFYY